MSRLKAYLAMTAAMAMMSGSGIPNFSGRDEWEQS